MKRILYANAVFDTDDAVAEAILHYASVLAVVNSSDVVECRGIDENGAVRSVQMLIGPASQIIAMDVDGASADLDVENVVTELNRRAIGRLPDYAGAVDEANDDRDSAL